MTKRAPLAFMTDGNFVYTVTHATYAHFLASLHEARGPFLLPNERPLSVASSKRAS